jgi:neutral trehalase
MPARELQPQEEKGSASPSTVPSKSEKNAPSAARLRQVQRVVSLTKHPEGKEALEAMWDKLQEVSRPEAWAETVERVKNYPERATMAPQRLTEVFLNLCACFADLD